MRISIDVIIQKNRPKALSVSATPSQLSQRESQGRGFDCTRKDGTIPDKSQTRSSICHSDRSVSGVEKSSTLDNEPTQDKIYNLRGFLDSLCSLGMTCQGVSWLIHTGYIRNDPRTVADNTRKHFPICHSDRSASGVEESTTWDNKNITCYLRGFLDSLRSLGMTCREVIPFNQTGCTWASIYKRQEREFPSPAVFVERQPPAMRVSRKKFYLWVENKSLQ